MEKSDLSNLTAIIATAAWAVCLFVDLRRNINRILSGRTAVLITVFMWYLLEALRVPKDLRKYTQEEFDLGVCYVALSTGLFLICYHARKTSWLAVLERRMPLLGRPAVVWSLLVVCLTIGFGALLIYTNFDFSELTQGLFGPRPRWSGISRGRYGSWSTLLYELQIILVAAVPLAVAMIFMKQASFLQRGLACFFFSWMTLRAFWSGSRSQLIPMLLALSAAVYWHFTPVWRKRLIIVGLPLAMLAGYYWSAIVVVGRNAGKFDMEAVAKVDYVGFEMFRELLFIVRATPEKLPLQYGMTYYTQLVNPIPRALWPDKPVADAGLILARALGNVDRHGEANLTNSPGFIGEAWLNFGFVGLVAVSAFSGFIIRSWDELFPQASQSFLGFIVYSGGIAAIVASGRSFNLNVFYALICLFGLLIILEFLGFAPRSNQPAPLSAMRQAPRTRRVPVGTQRF